jgi:hypothetical protein
MQGQLAQATEKLASVSVDRDEKSQALEAYKAVIEGIGDGSIDPDDCEEKLAELLEGSVKEASAKAVSSSAVSLGELGEETLVSESSNPLEEYLLQGV